MKKYFKIDKARMVILALSIFLFVELMIGLNYHGTVEVFEQAVGQKGEEGQRVPILMFHTFCKDNEKPVDIHMLRIGDFKKTLLKLYNNGFRLISLNDFLDNKINVPSGYKPVVLTFDDGLGNQFALKEKEGGGFEVDPNTAAGVLIEFCKKNPDFGKPRATFYMNFENETFGKVGTFRERLELLVKSGFEIGNHTYSHKTAKEMRGALELEEELGKNQYVLNKYLPGYKMTSFALPCGYELKSEELLQKARSGVYEGVKYENKAIMLAGWRPTLIPSNEAFKWNKVERIEVISTKRKFDLDYWMNNSSEANFLCEK